MSWWSGKSPEQERAEELNAHHNKGQTDASEGHDYPPHNFWDRAVTGVLFGPDEVAKLDADNDAYHAGQENQQNQSGK